MIKIFSPRDESELTVARSMLDAEGIPYHVKNEHFGSLYPGIAIKYINAKTVYVPAEFEEDAVALLSNFIEMEDAPETIFPDSSAKIVKKKKDFTLKKFLMGILKVIKKAGK
ncbi:MAG: DUF2007 domain-containing protein [Thermodesulfobacteriota bacterium]